MRAPDCEYTLWIDASIAFKPGVSIARLLAALGRCLRSNPIPLRPAVELIAFRTAPASDVPHPRFGALESLAQFGQVGNDRAGKGAFDLLRCDAIVADHKSDVRHVLRIVAAHHL